ncbi:MAG: hypothetical protein KJO65_01990 [Gemmatimonadetes bacterium]|nr:hypothetical protein [Gemmatimonadota bacterium]
MYASFSIAARLAAVLVLLTTVVLSSSALTPSSLSAQAADSARVAELERRLDAITRELERMDLGGDVVRADTAMQGLGPAASKVYRVERGVSLGGYGEFLYENYASEREDGSPATSTDQFDALRAILYVGYKFNDRLLFNSEIEVEHADEIFLEFAYVDYLINDRLGVRGGMLLAPMGLVNELHEPPIFLGSERPLTENRIIPTTWRENGVGLFGGNDAVSWRVYLMNSLDGMNFSASGLRGGRQKGSKALAEDFGLAGRLDYTGMLGLTVGASAYSGETAHNATLGGTEVGGRVTIWDLHADYRARGWDLRGLIAGASVDDVSALNQMIGLTGAEGIGTSMLGWYVQAGYDVLRGSTLEDQLLPYLRYERVDTQREVAEGFAVDPATDVTITSVGAAWKPAPQVVLKADYQLWSNAAETATDQWNVSLGWLF